MIARVRHVSRINILMARASHASVINLRRARLSYISYINLLIARLSHVLHVLYVTLCRLGYHIFGILTVLVLDYYMSPILCFRRVDYHIYIISGTTEYYMSVGARQSCRIHVY